MAAMSALRKTNCHPAFTCFSFTIFATWPFWNSRLEFSCPSVTTTTEQHGAPCNGRQ
jgi:hypothetical protein